MPQGYENWGAGGDKAKTAKIERSLAQDQGRSIKNELVRTEYPKKIIDKVDVGEICEFWAYKVMMILSNFDKKLIGRLNNMIHIAYEKGINLNTWKPFQTIMRRDGNTAITEKFNEMKQIPKLAVMGNLEKPKKKSSGYENVRM